MKLSFRTKRLSKVRIKRIILLFSIFLISLVSFSIILNYNPSSKKTSVATSTLPTVTTYAYGEAINELHGYIMEMDGCYMRDSIIPLDESRKLPLSIDTKGNNIDAISYEIRSLNTERKIADTDIKFENSDVIDLEFQVENLVDPGIEYLFILTLNCEGKDVNYYTRILIPEDSYQKECLDFVHYFHNTAKSDKYTSLSSYMETDGTRDNDLSYVDIHSSMNDLGWVGFEGEEVSEPRIIWSDINSNYNVIEMKYQMKTTSGKKTTYYNVDEYYRVRFTNDRMYLLDYHRKMDQVLDSQIRLDENTISLGITQSDIDYLANETGSIVAFVQAGELYEYNQDTHTLTQIYSSLKDQLNDSRALDSNQNIVLLNIDESGTLDFVVYGYMNRGEHEGTCGLQLNHYDSTTQTATEEAFITTTNSYQILNATFNKQLYKSSSNKFYIMINNSLLRVDLNTLSTEEILSNLSESQYACSGSGRYFAYIDEENASDKIHLWDLEEDKKTDITASSDSVLRPLAFMEDDFVYGIVKNSSISTDVAGTTLYPMSNILIVDSGNPDDIQLDYSESRFYVVDVTKSDYTLYLSRVTRSGNNYVAASEDTIKNSQGRINSSVPFGKVKDDNGILTSAFTLSEREKESHKYSLAFASYVSANITKNIVVEPSITDTSYFVYVGRQVVLASNDIVKSITSADENMGIVIDSNQRYIWKRGRKAYQSTLSGISSTVTGNNVSNCLSAMLSREDQNIDVTSLLANKETPISILERALKDYTVLDLTGCTLSEVLYYVSIGNPVYVSLSDTDAVLLVGYDAANVIVYHPSTGTSSKMGLQDATDMFEASGNVFITYLEK